MNRTIYITLPCVYKNITLFKRSFEGGQARFWPYFIREWLPISITPVNQIVVCKCSLCSWLHKINFVRTSQGLVWLIYIEQIGNRWGWNIMDALVGFNTTTILGCHIKPIHACPIMERLGGIHQVDVENNPQVHILFYLQLVSPSRCAAIIYNIRVGKCGPLVTNMCLWYVVFIR